MDASESVTSSVKSWFIWLIAGLTIRTTFAPVQAAHFTFGKDSKSVQMLAENERWVTRNLLDKEIKILSRTIEEMKGKNYTYENQIGFKLQFW